MLNNNTKDEITNSAIKIKTIHSFQPVIKFIILNALHMQANLFYLMSVFIMSSVYHKCVVKVGCDSDPEII